MYFILVTRPVKGYTKSGRLQNRNIIPYWRNINGMPCFHFSWICNDYGRIVVYLCLFYNVIDLLPAAVTSATWRVCSGSVWITGLDPF